VLLLALSGCTGDPAPEPASPTGHPAAPVRAQRARVTVHWLAHGETWPTVLAVPYGGAPGQLGIRHEHGLATAPTAFAATRRGFAILDPARGRVVEVSPDGRPVQSWPGITGAASDLAWDPVAGRLVVILDESRGRLAELLPGGTVRTVTLGWSPFRLATTAAGVVALGLRASGPTLRWVPVPTPLRRFGLGDETALPLGSGPDLTLEGLRRDGGAWRIARPGEWRTRLDLSAGSPPRRVVASLVGDVSATADRLLTAFTPGSFAQPPKAPTRRPLILAELDLDTGRLIGARQLDPCGLRDELLQATYLSTAPDGTAYQLCVGADGVEIRRDPRASGRN
jgi:hypothetical protein